MLHCLRRLLASSVAVRRLERVPRILRWWEAECWCSAGLVKWARVYCHAAAAKRLTSEGSLVRRFAADVTILSAASFPSGLVSS